MNLHQNAAELVSALRFDCLHYRGDRPCAPHRETGVRCTCDSFTEVRRTGVIIKLGAAGDVIRTTPLLRALDPVRNGIRILWVSHFPDFVPTDLCEPLPVSAGTLARLQAVEWDFCWNLDKDAEACSLAALTRAKERRGFVLRKGVPAPVDERGLHSFAAGIDDPFGRANTKNYIAGIFDIVGVPYRRERYLIKAPGKQSQDHAAELLPGGNWIGLNIGASPRWIARIWPEKYWAELATRLMSQGSRVVLLGGPEEHEINHRLSAQTGATYCGVHPLEMFSALIGRCDAVVSGVTMAMHLAIGLGTPLVLLNNIFNANEFELYDNGEIIGPPTPCDCFYDRVCRTKRECINEITPEVVLAAVSRRRRHSTEVAAGQTVR